MGREWYNPPMTRRNALTAAFAPLLGGIAATALDQPVCIDDEGEAVLVGLRRNAVPSGCTVRNPDGTLEDAVVIHGQPNVKPIRHRWAKRRTYGGDLADFWFANGDRWQHLLSL